MSKDKKDNKGNKDWDARQAVTGNRERKQWSNKDKKTGGSGWDDSLDGCNLSDEQLADIEAEYGL